MQMTVKETLLGFFWTACKAAQLVLVTTEGLQLYELHPTGPAVTKASKDLEARANSGLGDIVWHKWDFHCRLLLLRTEYELHCMQITAQVLSCIHDVVVEPVACPAARLLGAASLHASQAHPIELDQGTARHWRLCWLMWTLHPS